VEVASAGFEQLLKTLRSAQGIDLFQQLDQGRRPQLGYATDFTMVTRYQQR
jgi:hypothetical protein